MANSTTSICALLPKVFHVFQWHLLILYYKVKLNIPYLTLTCMGSQPTIIKVNSNCSHVPIPQLQEVRVLSPSHLAESDRLWSPGTGARAFCQDLLWRLQSFGLFVQVSAGALVSLSCLNTYRVVSFIVNFTCYGPTGPKCPPRTST